MDMVMHGFTESRKEVAELKKVEEARNIVQLKNNAIALKKADYTCEFNPAHESFINPKTGEKFMKAIHLIPVCKQNQIDADLSCVLIFAVYVQRVLIILNLIRMQIAKKC